MRAGPPATPPLVAVLDSIAIADEARIVGQLGTFARLTQRAPQLVVRRRYGNPPLGGLERLIRDDAGMRVAVAAGLDAGAERCLGDVDQPGQSAVEQRDFEPASRPVAVARAQRRENPRRGMQAAQDIDHRNARLGRRSLRVAGDAHQPALGLDDEVVAGAVGRLAT